MLVALLICAAAIVVSGVFVAAVIGGPAGDSPADAAGDAVRFVALGDSYTAGPGIPNQVTAGVPAGCRQSDQNYPHLVASNLRAVDFRDASCSGATTRTLTEPQRTSSGVHRPQLDGVTAATNLVTVGIGGNDVGFMSIVASCATRSPVGRPCRDRYVRDGDNEVKRRVEETASKITEALDAIRARAPRAKILVIGYPAIFPADGSECRPTVPITAEDIAFLNTEIKRLNAALAARAAEGGAGFVDNYKAFNGHDACRSVATRWIEPATPVNPGLSAHPNPAGERAMAEGIIKRVTGR